MTDPELIPEDVKALIDDYVNGAIDEAGMAELERRLLADDVAREYLVHYCRLETNLALAGRARSAGARALERIHTEAGGRVARWSRRGWWRAAAALVLLASGAALWMAGRARPARDAEVAWLVNAHDCQWADDAPLRGDLRPGRVLAIQRGLAQIRFASGATVVLQGPARLELLGPTSAKLHSGKLTAQVPPAAKGFAILSPQGRVVDLGTEFGISVGADGAADVLVYEGKVHAFAAQDAKTPVSLGERQAAQINASGVSPKAASSLDFARTIAPPPAPLPRRIMLDFKNSATDTLRDLNGLGTGITYRLPGTGAQLPPHDPNLRLNPDAGELELTTTRTDINTQHRLHEGEYLGFRLADLGFTGGEDFEITALIPNIPALQAVGQFGLYAGSRSDKIIRGGVISLPAPGQYQALLVNNDGGNDADPHRIGLLSSGADLRLTLRRVANRYSLTIENLSSNGSSTLTNRHPAFLDGEKDLYVGIFGANTQSYLRKKLIIRELKATVWTTVKRD